MTIKVIQRRAIIHNAILAAVVVMVGMVDGVRAQTIEQALEDKGSFCYVTKSGTVSSVRSPVRAGQYAFKHEVSTDSKRAEIDDCSWHAYNAKANVFWYGASYYLPSGSFSDDITSYVTQMRFSNIIEGGASEQNCTTRRCGEGGGESGSGHHLKVTGQKWRFTLRYQDPNCALCRGTVQEEFDLGSIATDTWTDLVFQAKWSHTTDGYLKIWKQVGDGGYVQVVNYQGRTWYDKYADGSNRAGQDVKAPNFTVGLYYSNKTNTRIMYTDEIRVYQQQSGADGFAVVRPDQHKSTTINIRTVKGSVAIDTRSLRINADVGVYNLLGKLVYRTSHEPGTINVNHSVVGTTGIYIIKIDNGATLLTDRFQTAK